MKTECMHKRASTMIVGLLFLIGLGVPAGAQEQSPPLTNEEVVKMAQAKLSDGLISAKIRASKSCRFDTEPATLVKLKELGVSDAVMEAMTQGCGNTVGAAATENRNDPTAPHDPGIYLVSTSPSATRLVQLEPTAYGQAKTGGFVKSALTSGIAKTKQKAVVRGGRAVIRAASQRPTFYFYFTAKQQMQASAWAGWFGEASSPNQFTLIRFDGKKDSRELIVGEFNNWGASSGPRSKDVVQFDFEKVSPGVYRVTLQEDVRPGEYAFFYTGTAVGYGAGGQLFDFGVDLGTYR